MKFCPVCQTRYDEEILRFCTKDGTPLVDENPSFTEMPSEGKAEDIGEETLISMNRPKSATPVQPSFEEESAQRIVIPTSEPQKEAVRAKPLPPPQQQQQPQKSNTVWVVLATMFGTFTVLAILGGIWYFLSNRNAADANKNINVNTSAPNTNYNINLNANNSSANFNFNANANENINVNANVNANLKTPTPTRTPTPTPSPTPEDDNANVNSNSNSGNSNTTPRPSATPTPSQNPPPAPSPRTSPSPTGTPSQNVNVGIMNSRAVSLTKPAYPQAAKQVNASGEVRVQISVDEGGNVTSARAITGHALLRSSAENAARQSRFNPVRIGDRTVSATGIVVYNFINQ